MVFRGIVDSLELVSNIQLTVDKRLDETNSSFSIAMNIALQDE